MGEEVSIVLSAGIMGVPERNNHIRNYLIPELQKYSIPVKVSYDMKHNDLWGNAERTLLSYTSDATHHIRLQDDVQLCDDFKAGITEVVSEYPDEVINLMLSPRPVIQKALLQDIHWIKCTGVCWGAGWVMPVKLIDEFIDWCRQHVRRSYFHDDGRMELWTQLTGRSVYLPVPMLIQHLGAMKSILGVNRAYKVSGAYIGETSPLDIDWDNGKVLTLNERIPQAYIDKWCY